MHGIPLVSIGIPTYNRASTLARSIESALTQDYSNIELIISDNASSDETESLCRSYAKLDERVKYVRQANNRGMTANFVEVLAQSTGKYFMWLSDDDWLGAHYISRCLDELGADDELSLVCGVTTYVKDDETTFKGVKVDLTQGSAVERVLRYYGSVIDNGTFYGIMRRATLAALVLPNVLGGDWLWVGSLAFLGKIVSLEDVTIFRSAEGVSADVRSLALTFGLSARKARQPHRMISINIFKYWIGRNAPAFAALNKMARFRLAASNALIVRRRFVAPSAPLKTLARRVRALLSPAIRRA